MIERWGREAAGDAGKAEFISILHFQKEAPTTLTQKQTAQPPCKQHAQWCSPGIQSASNSLPLSTSAALCSAANFGPVDTIHQSSLPLSFWAVHAVCILIALFIHQQSGKMCICICEYVRGRAAEAPHVYFTIQTHVWILFEPTDTYQCYTQNILIQSQYILPHLFPSFFKKTKKNVHPQTLCLFHLHILHPHAKCPYFCIYSIIVPWNTHMNTHTCGCFSCPDVPFNGPPPPSVLTSYPLGRASGPF